MRLIVAALSACLLALPDALAAESLKLAGAKRWLTIASTKDIDTAIGISSIYAFQKARVVSSKSGFYAVILGPYEGASVAAVLKANPDIGEVPKDSRLSKGDKYLETVWRESSQENQPLVEYAPGKPARMSFGSLSYTVTMNGTEEEPGTSVAKGEQGGRTLFSFTSPSDFALLGAEAGALKLDPDTEFPQLFFTRYTGGAHCCTQNWIVTKPKGQDAWILVDAGVLDGGGFGFEDLDKDGALELLNVDNSFLYAFDSYAGSFAPIRISQLRGGNLSDVSNEAAFRPQLRQDLARMEFQAKLDPSLWKTNGFLVGWLAAKMRLGQGEEAWQTLEENTDRDNGFGPQICKTGKPLEDCAFEDLEQVPILEAIARFMAEQDYGELPQQALALVSKK